MFPSAAASHRVAADFLPSRPARMLTPLHHSANHLQFKALCKGTDRRMIFVNSAALFILITSFLANSCMSVAVLRKSEMNLIDTNQTANVAQTSNEDPGKVRKSDKSVAESRYQESQPKWPHADFSTNTIGSSQ